MQVALIIAWAVRTSLLLLALPLAVVAELLRLSRALDSWSSSIILEHKATAENATPGCKVVVIRPATRIIGVAHQ